MRDGIELARLDIPVVALLTEEFWPQGDFVAEAAGMPGVPRVRLPHPVAGTGQSRMATIATDNATAIVSALASPGSR